MTESENLLCKIFIFHSLCFIYGGILWLDVGCVLAFLARYLIWSTTILQNVENTCKDIKTF